MMNRARTWLAWAMICLVPAAFHAQAQRGDASEASVKAAFLHKFAGYIDWPPAIFATPGSPFVIGVSGSSEVAAELEKIVAGRNISGHPVVVRRVRELEPLKGIHFLFAGRGDAPRLPAILKAAQAQGVLTVTEAERGLDLGSAINFVVADDRVGFEVSLESAEKSGHRISSRMLAVAKRVVPRS